MKHYPDNEFTYATTYRNHYKWGILKRKAEIAREKESNLEKLNDHYTISLFDTVIAHFDPDNDLILKDNTLFFLLRKCIKAMGYKTVNEAKDCNYELYDLFFTSTTIFMERAVSFHKRFKYLKALNSDITPLDIALEITNEYASSSYFMKKFTEDDAFSFVKQKLDWTLSTHIKKGENKISRVSLKVLEKLRKDNIKNLKDNKGEKTTPLPLFNICSLDEAAYHYDDDDSETTLKDTISSPVNEEENLIDRSWILQKHREFFSKHAAGDLVLLTLVDINTGRLTSGFIDEIDEARCGRTNAETYAYLLNKVSPVWIIDAKHAVNNAVFDINREMERLYSWSPNTLTKHGKDIHKAYVDWMKDPSMTYTPIKKPRKARKACKANK